MLMLAVAVSAGVVDAASTCGLVEQYFARHNLSADDGDAPGANCFIMTFQCYPFQLYVLHVAVILSIHIGRKSTYV